MKRFLNLMLATSMAVLTSLPASAGLLRIETTAGPDGSFEGSLQLGDPHDVDVTKGAEGWYNANLSATQDVTLIYEFLGFEAGWTNTFIVDGSQVFWNKANSGNSASAIGATTTSSAGAGTWLDFAFQILAGGNSPLGVTNGANSHPTNTGSGLGSYGAPNFFLGFVDSSENSVYITLDDGGGGPWYQGSLDDDDHDDLVIRVTARAVPEPGTLGLLGIGLLGLGFSRRKRA